MNGVDDGNPAASIMRTISQMRDTSQASKAADTATANDDLSWDDQSRPAVGDGLIPDGAGHDGDLNDIM